MGVDDVSKTARLLLELDKKLSSIDDLLSESSKRLLEKSSILAKSLDSEMDEGLQSLFNETDKLVKEYIEESRRRHLKELEELRKKLEEEAKTNYEAAFNSVLNRIIGALSEG